ncbi:MAG: hypothetical protein VR68_02580 [Peptococcaceae bacterium BRH_c4a]|nr:MAG: hypothetical protein VR68_02580 [Peptococcaceae bacterium BRH_c4a]
MEIQDFAYVINRTDAYQTLCSLMRDQYTTDALEQKISDVFRQAYVSGYLVYCKKNGDILLSDKDAELCFFNTGLMNLGEEIWAKFTLNRNPGRQKWAGIWFERKDLIELEQDSFIIGDICFDSWDSGLRFIDEVAELAIDEKWDYDYYPSKIRHPILKSYLENIYFKLVSEKKIIEKSNKVVFNTGLINTYFEEVYVVCDISSRLTIKGPRLTNAKLCLSSQSIFYRSFSEKPKMAKFFTNIFELVYDPNLDTELYYKHIIEDNYSRIKDKVGVLTKAQLIMLLPKAAEIAGILAERNYKLIVPQYWKKSKSIQFLMPIYFSGEFSGRPDVALVLEKHETCYRGTTILTIDMAYQNARILAKPDNFWLNP